jgi:hypothetical protein
MLGIAFIRWWYGAGWNAVTVSVRHRVQRTIDSFSVPTLVRTLFSPWKRIVTVPGSGLDAHMHAMADNLISRVVGFGVRLTVLFSAGVSLVALTIFGVMQIILWPLVPLLAVTCVIGGVAL